MTNPVLQQIAARANADFRAELPADAIHAAKRCLLDWYGLVLGGMQTPTLRAVQAACRGESGSARVVGLPQLSLPPTSAALLMGTASHVLDYDDTDYINLIHVSSTLLPALFAHAGSVRISGDALLRAIVAGFEAEDRIGFYLGRELTACGFHVSGVIGHIGAALATALVSAMDPERSAHAMAIAATGASGFIAAFGTMSKPLQLGRAASGGLLATKLAAEGFTGPVAGFDNQAGIVNALIGNTPGNWSHVDEAWGKPYAILQNSFKPHASCMITHPTIDAAIAIHHALQAPGRRLSEIETVECRINRLVPHVAGIPMPRTGLEGKFSAAYCCAAGLLFGRATPEIFSEDAVAGAAIQTLTSRVNLIVDEAIGEQQARVVLRLMDGSELTHTTEMAKGNPANPLSDAELEAKFLALTEPSLGSAARTVAAQLWQFGKVDDVNAWLIATQAGKEA